jgi:hypothetical protein
MANGVPAARYQSFQPSLSAMAGAKLVTFHVGGSRLHLTTEN